MPAANPDLPLQLSATAIAEIRRLCKQWGYTTAQIRLGIAPGGCQSQHYTLGFRPEDILEQDHTYPLADPRDGDLHIAIAPEALPALQGCTLDYAEDLMGGNFRFQHSPVSGLCACGLSFDQVVSSP